MPPEVLASTWVVIPAYQEAVSIAGVVRGLVPTYPNVVVVDDGSGDDTFVEARRAGATVLRHVLNRGQGASLQTSIEYALRQGAQYVVTFDADGQHCVEDIAELLRPIVAGDVDISLGSRFLGDAIDIPTTRRLVLKAAVVFTRIVNRMRLTDTHNGLRAFSRRAAEIIDIHLDRMAHASEIIDQIRRSHLRYQEVPVRIRYTEHSLAKGQSSGHAVRIAVDYLVGRIMR